MPQAMKKPQRYETNADFNSVGQLFIGRPLRSSYFIAVATSGHQPLISLFCNISLHVSQRF